MTAEPDDLKANFDTARYRQGEMMEEWRHPVPAFIVGPVQAILRSCAKWPR
jgi:hypothetical protein